jgi:hypothetical protein
MVLFLFLFLVSTQVHGLLRLIGKGLLRQSHNRVHNLQRFPQESIRSYLHEKKQFVYGNFHEFANVHGLPAALKVAEMHGYSSLKRLMSLEGYLTSKYDDDTVSTIRSLMSCLNQKNEDRFLSEFQAFSHINPNDLVSADGTTALMLACTSNLFNVVQFLLTIKFIDVSTENINGETALSLAEKHGNIGCVLLIRRYMSAINNEDL